MKWIKTAALVLAGLFVLLAAAGAYLVATFDAERYKGLAIDWVRDHRERTLAIDGPVSLSLLPRLAVKLERVSLSEHRRPQEFARFDEAALSVELWPLLRRELVVDRMRLSGAHVRYARDAQGRRNVDDLLRPEAPPAPANGTAGGAGARLDISAIELHDVRLSIDDRPAGLRGDVTLRTLRAGRLAEGVESPLVFDALLALQQPALQGALKGETRFAIDLGSGAIALRELSAEYRGSMPGMQFDTLSLALQRFGFEPARKRLTLEQVALDAKAKRDGEPLVARLRWPRLQVDDQALAGSALEGGLTLGPRGEVQVTFQSGAPTGSFDRIGLPALRARIVDATRKLSAEFGADVALRPAQAALALDSLELRAQMQETGASPFVLALKGRAKGSGQAASWQLGGTLNDNRLDSRGSVSFAGAVPAVKAEAQFAALDLDRVLPKARPDTPAPQPTDTPIDLGVLNKLQGSFSLRAGSLVSRPYRLDDARLGATLENGLLRVHTLAGRVWGGSFDGAASADARSQRFALKGTAQGIDMRAALRDLADKDLLEGTGRFSVDLASAGRSVAELKARANGSGAMQLRDGAIKGINLARALREAKAALALRSDALQQARQAEKTDFSELSASFRVTDGIARSNDLDVKSPFLRLAGEGAVDIPRNRIDYTLRATVADTAKGQGGAELQALRGLTVPVRLSGPLEAVNWQIQWSAVAQAAARQRLEDTLKDRLGLRPGEPAGSAPQPTPSSKDRLKDSLRGLFR